MPAFLAGTLPGGANLFSSPPPHPRINDPNAPKPPTLPPIPRKIPRKPPPPPRPNPALKSNHSRTKYYKPVSPGVVSTEGDRSVVVGENGVSYLLPDAPFEFRFSYSETPKVKPLAFREPAFLPFAPPTMPRPWTGKAPLKSKKEKELKRQKRVRLVQPFRNEGMAGVEEDGRGGKVMEMARVVPSLGQYPQDGRSQQEILGKPLTKAEVRALVKPCLSQNRQVNIGRDGLTHNMLELIHSHWRREKVCKVRCRGVPTVDMDNVCHHLEEKTMGKIIYRVGGVVYLFRGRNYDHRTRPRYPIMLWKPATPVYPKLIQETPEGLTKQEADELRSKGRKLLPICKLAKNGIYINLVKDVRDAFEGSPLVKIDCQGLETSDYRKIGAKLKELVPCVLLSFDEEQILMWRGKEWKSRYLKSKTVVSHLHSTKRHNLSSPETSGQSNGISGSPIKKEISSPRMLSLWNRAIETKKALFLSETMLSPDALLTKVEEFESMSQAAEHSYTALIMPNNGGIDASTELKDVSETDVSDDSDADHSYSDAYFDNCDDDDASDSFDELDNTVPFGSMPVDIIAKRLSLE